jgi:hypothetical protein
MHSGSKSSAFQVHSSTVRISTFARRAPVLTLFLIAGPVLVGHVIAGGTPLSLDYPAHAFLPDANTEPARAVVRAIGPDASVQAPDALLAHVAERPMLHRIASVEFGDDYTVLDVWHRRVFAATGSAAHGQGRPFAPFLAPRSPRRARGRRLHPARARQLTRRHRSARSSAPIRAGELVSSCLSVIDAAWRAKTCSRSTSSRRACRTISRSSERSSG